MEIRRANERGYADHGWLRSYHTFSFANYFDPKHMGFHALRVINEDRVSPGQGFGTHAHSDMEIISYVIDGALEHKDSMGTGSIIRPGDVQRMSAGTGVRHSEFNPSKDSPVHFLQIWIQPSELGIEPSYEQKSFPKDQHQGGAFRLLAAPGGQDGSVTIHQDAKLYSALLDEGTKTNFEVADGRGAWLHVVTGSVSLDGTELSAGDAASLVTTGSYQLIGRRPSEVLLFDLAGTGTN